MKNFSDMLSKAKVMKEKMKEALSKARDAKTKKGKKEEKDKK